MKNKKERIIRVILLYGVTTFWNMFLVIALKDTT